MSANQNSRRNFLKTIAEGSLSTLIIPDSLTSFENEMSSPVSNDNKLTSTEYPRPVKYGQREGFVLFHRASNKQSATSN